jgi:hypothetical protein
MIGKEMRHGPADPACSTGDDDDFIFKFKRMFPHFKSPSNESPMPLPSGVILGYMSEDQSPLALRDF